MPQAAEECKHLLRKAECAVCSPPLAEQSSGGASFWDELWGLNEDALPPSGWGAPFPAAYSGRCAADESHLIEPGDLIARTPGNGGYACGDCVPGPA